MSFVPSTTVRDAASRSASPPPAATARTRARRAPAWCFQVLNSTGGTTSSGVPASASWRAKTLIMALPSSRRPADQLHHQEQRHADQPADERAVEPNPVQVLADPLLDQVGHRLVGQPVHLLLDEVAQQGVVLLQLLRQEAPQPAVDPLLQRLVLRQPQQP